MTATSLDPTKKSSTYLRLRRAQSSRGYVSGFFVVSASFRQNSQKVHNVTIFHHPARRRPSLTIGRQTAPVTCKSRTCGVNESLAFSEDTRGTRSRVGIGLSAFDRSFLVTYRGGGSSRASGGGLRSLGSSESTGIIILRSYGGGERPPHQSSKSTFTEASGVPCEPASCTSPIVNTRINYLRKSDRLTCNQLANVTCKVVQELLFFMKFNNSDMTKCLLENSTYRNY